MEKEKLNKSTIIITSNEQSVICSKKKKIFLPNVNENARDWWNETNTSTFTWYFIKNVAFFHEERWRINFIR